MKNNITDLANHLFAELERLGDEELEGEKLDKEIERAKAIALVGRQLVDAAKVAVDATKLKAEYGTAKIDMPPLIEPKAQQGRQ